MVLTKGECESSWTTHSLRSKQSLAQQDCSVASDSVFLAPDKRWSHHFLISSADKKVDEMFLFLRTRRKVKQGEQNLHVIHFYTGVWKWRCEKSSLVLIAVTPPTFRLEPNIMFNLSRNNDWHIMREPDMDCTRRALFFQSASRLPRTGSSTVKLMAWQFS